MKTIRKLVKILVGASSLIEDNAVSAKPGDPDYQNQVFLFQHGWNNGVVKAKEGDERHWNSLLNHSLSTADWFNDADADETLEQRHS